MSIDWFNSEHDHADHVLGSDLDEDRDKGSPFPQEQWTSADEEDEGGHINEDNYVGEEGQGQDIPHDEYNDSRAEPALSFPHLYIPSSDPSGDEFDAATRTLYDVDELVQAGSDDECKS